MTYTLRVSFSEFRNFIRYQKDSRTIIMTQEFIEWMEENIGTDWHYNRSYEGNFYTFEFICEEDAMAFKLRWL